MRINLTVFVFAFFLASCAALGPSTPSPGRFVHAGPTNAAAEELSIQWMYIFNFAVAQSAISHVKFSCDGIPGTVVSVRGKDLKIDAKGSALVYGESIPLSKDTAAWLYDSDTTRSVCTAVVSQDGKEDMIERVPITFAAATKMALLQEFKSAHEYNRKLKTKR